MLFAKSGPISKCAREAVQSSDIARLRPGQWLNDEIINFYGAMILERANAKENHNPKTNGALNGKGKKPMKVHYFSTFFWPKLNEGYEKSKLNRWTKKVRLHARCCGGADPNLRRSTFSPRTRSSYPSTTAIRTGQLQLSTSGGNE